MLKLQLQIGVQPDRDRRGWAAGRAFDAKAVQFRTAEDNKRATLCMAQLIKLAAAITMPVTNAARQQYNNTSFDDVGHHGTASTPGYAVTKA
jgi:hypothetical protein